MASAALGVAITAAIIGDTAVGERLRAFQISWWTMVAVMALAPVLLRWRYPRTGAERPWAREVRATDS